MIDLQEIIRDTLELEPLSQSASRLARLVGADEIDLEEIVSVVKYDEALSARPLRAANAAAAGSLAEILTVDAAVVRLGPAWVLSLAMAAALQTRFDVALPQFGLGEGELWRHSMSAAIAAEELLELTDTEIPLEAPTTALMHDIGQLVLARHVRRYMQLDMRRLCAEQGLSGLKAESRVLDINHAELGAMVARHWGLPESIAEGIAYHHHPSEAPPEVNPLLVHAVHLADAVSEVVLGGADRSYLSLEELKTSLDILGLRPADLRRFCAAVAKRTDRVLATST